MNEKVNADKILYEMKAHAEEFQKKANECKRLYSIASQKFDEASASTNAQDYLKAKLLFQQAGKAYYDASKICDNNPELQKKLLVASNEMHSLANIVEIRYFEKECLQKFEKEVAAFDADNYKEAKSLLLERIDILYKLLSLSKDNDYSNKLLDRIRQETKKMVFYDEIILRQENLNKQKTTDSHRSISLKNNSISQHNNPSLEIGQNQANIHSKTTQHSKLDELIDELNALIGLQEVKNQVKKRIDTIRVEQAAKEAGSSRKACETSLHMVFAGNPGTGKTTVARLIGKIYGALGVISDGNKFIETDRSGLVGKYVGHTAQLVTEKVNEALGGVLFIDEAYSLYKAGSELDFGEEAVSTLVKCMEDHRDNLVVILAGYTDLMKVFIEKSNPGLQSRFRTWITFEDYSTDEMVKIFHAMLRDKGMFLAKDAEDPLRQLIIKRSSKPNFGNGRGVRNLLEDILDENNSRLAKALNSGERVVFDTIEAEDIYKVLMR